MSFRDVVTAHWRRLLGTAPGTQCEYCERGKYDHDLDPSTECLLCMPGTVAVTEKSTECEICNAGQYTDEFRMMCKDCARPGQPSTSPRGAVC